MFLPYKSLVPLFSLYQCQFDFQVSHVHILSSFVDYSLDTLMVIFLSSSRESFRLPNSVIEVVSTTKVPYLLRDDVVDAKDAQNFVPLLGKVVYSTAVKAVFLFLMTH